MLANAIIALSILCIVGTGDWGYLKTVQEEDRFLLRYLSLYWVCISIPLLAGVCLLYVL